MVATVCLFCSVRVPAKISIPPLLFALPSSLRHRVSFPSRVGPYWSDGCSSRYKDLKWLEEVIAETLDDLTKLGMVRAHRLSMQWCSRRPAVMRACLARFIAWVAATCISLTKPKKGAMTTADVELHMGRPSRLPSISSKGPGLSDYHKKKLDTHLLDIRNPRVRFQNAVLVVIKLQRTMGKRATPAHPGLPRRDSW